MYMGQKQAGLIDVAQAARVAKSTVAAALRPGGGGKNARVSKATAARIRKIAAELGYRPNVLAAGLRGASTSSVAAVWQFVDLWYHDARIVNQLLARFQADGIATYQAEHPAQPERLISVLSNLLERRPDALIIQWRPDLMDHEGVRAIVQQFKATLAVVPWPVQGMEIDQVILDRTSAFRDVIRHFANSGRRRLCVMLHTQDLTDRQKYEVIVDECRRWGLEIHDRMLLDLAGSSAPPEDQAGTFLSAVQQHFPGEIDADAILCANDVAEMVVAKFLRERGVRIGKDVALVGLNDPPALALWDPPLATIDRNHAELQRVIYDLMSRRLANPQMPPEQRTVHMRMVWRESAGGEPPRPQT